MNLYIIVEGKVQGVCFRAYAKEKADSLGIKGWIKNSPNRNKVEIAAQGDKKQLDTFIDWCRQGPTSAHVSNIIIEDAPEEHFQQFTIKF